MGRPGEERESEGVGLVFRLQLFEAQREGAADVGFMAGRGDPGEFALERGMLEGIHQ